MTNIPFALKQNKKNDSSSKLHLLKVSTCSFFAANNTQKKNKIQTDIKIN